MVCKNYNADVVVIHKTKLAEADLILDMISADGELIRGVAKSARKPGNTFSNRLDLFNVARISLARTKKLHIIRECRLVESFENIRGNLDSQRCASMIAELVWRITFDGAVNPRMFDFLQKSFEMINENIGCADLLALAGCFKVLALEGYAPNLEAEGNYFSCSEGGIVDDDENAFEISKYCIGLIRYLLASTYEQIIALEEFSLDEAFFVLDSWIKFHIGYELKSLRYT